MRYITKYLQDRRIAVAGMTQTELVDASIPRWRSSAF